MKTLYATMILGLLGLQLEAAAVNLNEAVNQVKSEGRVLSAKTVNNKHEIKVLTPAGTVKTYNMDVSNNVSVKTNPQALKYRNPIGQPMREDARESRVPDRFDNPQKGVRSDKRKMNLQPVPKNDKPVKKNDKDK